MSGVLSHLSSRIGSRQIASRQIASQPVTRIPSLDGLRAISILLVVAGHWAELRYRPSELADVAGAFANLGVRIFFVISGYLITMLLLKEHARTSTIGLREFYVRRAYRILPAAMAFMLPVFVVYWHQLRWYHMAAAALYVANLDVAHPWFLGHLWSLSVEEQFYFLWPGVLKKWYRHRVAILVGVVLFAPLYRMACHFLGLHGQADETFPAVADVLAIGCLTGVFERGVKIPHLWQNRPEVGHPGLFAMGWRRIPTLSPKSARTRVGQPAGQPRIGAMLAALMLIPVVLVPIYVGVLRFHITPVLLFVLWPVMHFSIAGLLLHVVERPYWILNARPVVWLGRISYSLYLWQQLFVFGEHPRPWYFVLLAIGLASASYYLVEQPMLRVREKRSREQLNLLPVRARSFAPPEKRLRSG
jgi:peptidoglycan/LPS O-acetylase OafA/YrhL